MIIWFLIVSNWTCRLKKIYKFTYLVTYNNLYILYKERKDQQMNFVRSPTHSWTWLSCSRMDTESHVQPAVRADSWQLSMVLHIGQAQIYDLCSASKHIPRLQPDLKAGYLAGSHLSVKLRHGRAGTQSVHHRQTVCKTVAQICLSLGDLTHPPLLHPR